MSVLKVLVGLAFLFLATFAVMVESETVASDNAVVTVYKILCTFPFMYLLAGNRVLPVLTDVSHLFCAPAIVRNAVAG